MNLFNTLKMSYNEKNVSGFFYYITFWLNNDQIHCRKVKGRFLVLLRMTSDEQCDIFQTEAESIVGSSSSSDS